MPELRASISILNRYTGSYSSPKVEEPTTTTNPDAVKSNAPPLIDQSTTADHNQRVTTEEQPRESKFSIPKPQATNISQALPPSLIPDSGQPTADEDLFFDQPDTGLKPGPNGAGFKGRVGSTISNTLSNASNRLPKIKRRRTDRTSSSSSSNSSAVSTGDKVRAKFHDFVENPTHPHRNHQDKLRERQKSWEASHANSTSVDRDVVGAGSGTGVGVSTTGETGPSTSGHVGEMSSMARMKAGIMHPRRKIQDKVTMSAAEEITTHLPEHPISEECDEEFLYEWETLCELMKQKDSKTGLQGRELREQVSKLRELEKRRNDMKVKWTLKRHAKYLHVSELQKFNKVPDVRDFNKLDAEGAAKTDFGRWLGYVCFHKSF